MLPFQVERYATRCRDARYYADAAATLICHRDFDTPGGAILMMPPAAIYAAPIEDILRRRRHATFLIGFDRLRFIEEVRHYFAAIAISLTTRCRDYSGAATILLSPPMIIAAT